MNKAYLPIAAAAVILAGAGCDQKKTDSPSTSAPAEVPSAPKPSSSVLGTPTPAPSRVSDAPSTPAPSEPSPEEVAKTVAAMQEMDTVLRDKSLSTAQAGERMAALASDSTVPLQNRTEALQHALNLLPDEGFDAVDGLLSTKETPTPLLDMVFAEVHNRSVATQVPVALALLKSSDPDVSIRARQLLSFHLEQDFGDDLDAWVKPTEEFLSKVTAGSQQ